jgi:hypothetical protein
VPLAPNRFGGADVAAGTLTPAYDSFWMHGITAGLEFRF